MILADNMWTYFLEIYPIGYSKIEDILKEWILDLEESTVSKEDELFYFSPVHPLNVQISVTRS